MRYMGISTVIREKKAEHINRLWGQNVDLFLLHPVSSCIHYTSRCHCHL